jgi:hypothetical protein
MVGVVWLPWGFSGGFRRVRMNRGYNVLESVISMYREGGGHLLDDPIGRAWG